VPALYDEYLGMHNSTSGFAKRVKFLVASLVLLVPLLAQTPIKIAIAGDSTVADYPGNPNQAGWGQFLPEYFNSSVHIYNLAKNGRSTKTFLNEGLWAKVLALKPDFVLIQFGHNDSHDPKQPEATSAARDYPNYLSQFVDEARAAGAIPILVTPVQRRTKVDTLIPYVDAMRKVADEKHVPLIDLHASSGELYRKLGPAAVIELQANGTDQTHFSLKGAREIAALVMRDLPHVDPRLQQNLR
jgi:lysophospholipase L1-like esterase